MFANVLTVFATNPASCLFYLETVHLMTTAEFYRQDALTAPNVTQADLTWPNSA